MITETRRLIARAATDWQDSASCRQADADVFFSDAYQEQQKARAVCVRCRSLLPCLTTGLADEERMPSGYRFGVVGGLRAEQRRALHWETILHGGPDLAAAARLARGKYGFLLQELWRQHLTLEEVAERLAEQGVVVDTSTVRVAVWWQGGRAPRVKARAEGDLPDSRRLVRDYADVLRQLSGLGAPRADMAAYLGVSLENVVRAMRTLNERRPS
jgi:hypothetical protein